MEIRWMIRRDMIEVLEIEWLCFEHAWPGELFIRELRKRNVIGMVAEDDQRVVGYMIYALHKARIHLMNFAVHPDAQRGGVGTAMVDRLKVKLSSHRRWRLLLEVCETNLPAQQFFCACGFRAISILHDLYYNSDEDAYQMEYRHGQDDWRRVRQSLLFQT